MRVAILIPARFESTRYPGKPLAALRGAAGLSKPLVQRTFEAARRVQGASSIHVVTDDERIAQTAAAFGSSVIMTSLHARNGTERCAEALDALDDVDLVINLQGDALLTPPHFLERLIEAMQVDRTAEVATLSIRLRPDEVRAMQDEQGAGRVGGTSVVTDSTGRALYFSKRLIPYLPNHALNAHELSVVKLHIGVYAYRPEALRRYLAMPPSVLELLEGLEQLRFLDASIPIKVVDLEPPPFSLRELNNPEDVEPIEQALAAAGLP